MNTTSKMERIEVRAYSGFEEYGPWMTLAEVDSDDLRDSLELALGDGERSGIARDGRDLYSWRLM